jgi:hypothetical protein
MNQGLADFVIECDVCKEAVANLERVKSAVSGGTKIHVEGQLQRNGAGSPLFSIIGSSLVVDCSECKNHRKLLTPEGRVLAELALAELENGPETHDEANGVGAELDYFDPAKTDRSED